MTSVRRRVTCIVCPIGCEIQVDLKNGEVFRVEGNACVRGVSYAIEECTSPRRVLTTLVGVRGGNLPVTSVKTTKPIPKALLRDVQNQLTKIVLEAPVYIGKPVVRNILETGADVVVTRSVKRVQDASI